MNRQTKNRRDARGEMGVCIPDVGPNVLRIWFYWLSHLVDGFFDVHSSDDIRHQQPHVRLSEHFPRANSSAEPKESIDLVSDLRIHLAYETFGAKLLRFWVELLIPGDCPVS